MIYGHCATDPHLFLLYVCCTTGAHQPSTGWAPPIRARVKARLVRWAQTVEINTNNFKFHDIVSGLDHLQHQLYLISRKIILQKKMYGM